MKSIARIFCLLFCLVLLVTLCDCLSKKNPIVVATRNFPEEVNIPLEDLDKKFWFAVLNGQPVESGKYFVNCFDFRDIVANDIVWASTVYAPRKPDANIVNDEYIPIDAVKNNQVKVYFDTKQVAGKTMIVSNYFIVYIEVDGDYFNEKIKWGGERISKFIFPQADFTKLKESFDKKTIAQLVLFEGYEKKGEQIKVKFNFGQSVYVDDFSSFAEEKKLEEIKKKLISRNKYFIESGGIFESLWVEHNYVDADDALRQQWKVKSSVIDNVSREYECGRAYDRNGKVLPF